MLKWMANGKMNGNDKINVKLMVTVKRIVNRKMNGTGKKW